MTDLNPAEATRGAMELIEVASQVSPLATERGPNIARPCFSHPMIASGPHDLAFKSAFIGVGFSPAGVPLEVLTIYLAGRETGSYTILLVDQFQRMNGVAEADVMLGLNRLRKTFAAFDEIFGLKTNYILASELMVQPDYANVLEDMRVSLANDRLQRALLDTVPSKYRHLPSALEYPLHEIACTEMLRRCANISVKVGPGRERLYDSVMEEAGVQMEFAYLVDALPFGASRPRPVVHYIPGHNGSAGGSRAFLNLGEERAMATVRTGSDASLRYALSLASAAGECRGGLSLSQAEIQSLNRTALEQSAVELLRLNVFRPLAAVTSEEY